MSTNEYRLWSTHGHWSHFNFFSLIKISKSEILIPAFLWRKKNTKTPAYFTFLLYRYITSQSWQCPTHPSQPNEHVPAPLHHQHHAPSQPQAKAYSGDQNHKQEFNCKFKHFIKMQQSAELEKGITVVLHYLQVNLQTEHIYVASIKLY